MWRCPAKALPKLSRAIFFFLFKYRLPTRSSVSSPPSFSFPFLPASPPIEWLSDKACDYIDLVQGQTLSPPVCLSVCLFVLSLFLYLPGLIAFPLRFFFFFLTFHVLVFFFPFLLHFPSPLSFRFQSLRKASPRRTPREHRCDCWRLREHMRKQGRKERHPLFGISWNQQSQHNTISCGAVGLQ